MSRAARWLWSTTSVCIAAVVLLPILVVLASVFMDGDGVFLHLARTRLAEYSWNTVALVAIVATLSFVLGVTPAWLVSMHRFPGRGLLAWALILPLAVPGYLAAYAMTDLLQPAGPLRAIAIGSDGVQTWWPRVRSLPGAAIILSLSLYPYVYLAARAAFLALPHSLIDASRTLGLGPWRTFARVALPLSAPTIGAGLLFVVMETMADFGVADYCAVDTFATGVYRAWTSLGSPAAAGQLASVLLGAVFLIVLVATIARGKRRFHTAGARTQPPPPASMSGPLSAVAILVCLLPIVGGFVVPAAWLAILAVDRGDPRAAEVMIGHGRNTFMLASIAACVASMLAFLLVLARRWTRARAPSVAFRTAQLGYAVPGTVLAVGVMTSLVWVDHRLNEATHWLADARPGLLLSGTVVAVLIGYQSRFLAIPTGLLGAAMDRVSPRVDESAQTMGASPLRIAAHVHTPALRPAILAATLLVFVDVCKELPMTLMLRPFGMETLAVRVYQLASDERLSEAATGALAIIVLGLIPVFVLASSMGRPCTRCAGSRSCRSTIYRPVRVLQA